MLVVVNRSRMVPIRILFGTVLLATAISVDGKDGKTLLLKIKIQIENLKQETSDKGMES